MPLFLYALKASRPELLTGGPTDEESAVLERHDAYLSGLFEQEAVVFAGRTEAADYGTFAIIVLRAESEPEARRMVSADPVVSERVMRAELSPLRVTLRGDLAQLPS